jgi:hypothetical protein
MGFKDLARSLGGSAGVARLKRDAEAVERKARTFFVELKGRPMSVTIDEDTDAALLAATDVDDASTDTDTAPTLRGLARVNGRLISLHDLDVKHVKR